MKYKKLSILGLLILSGWTCPFSAQSQIASNPADSNASVPFDEALRSMRERIMSLPPGDAHGCYRIIEEITQLERADTASTSASDTRIGDWLLQLLKDVSSDPELRDKYTYRSNGINRYLERAILDRLASYQSREAAKFLVDYALRERLSLNDGDSLCNGAVFALLYQRRGNADAEIMRLWNAFKAASPGPPGTGHPGFYLRIMAGSDRIPDEEAKPVLLDAAQKGFYPLFGKFAKLYGAEAAPILRLQMEHKDAQIRGETISILGHLGDKASIEPFVAHLQDEHPSVRLSAVYALGYVQAVEHVGTLERLIAETQDEDIKRGCIFSLQEIQGNEAHEALKRLRELDRNNPQWQKKLRTAIAVQKEGSRSARDFPRMDATPTPTPTPIPQ